MARIQRRKPGHVYPVLTLAGEALLVVRDGALGELDPLGWHAPEHKPQDPVVVGDLVSCS